MAEPVPPTIDAEAARDAARDILSGAEYREPQPSPVERAAEWFFDQAGSVFGALTGGGPGSVIGWLIVAALVGGATWLLVRALRLPPVAGPAAGRGVHVGTETRHDPAGWLAEAARLAGAGDHRGALRCRYQALLAALVRRGVLDDVPGRTAREHADHLAAALPRHRTGIDELTGWFEAVWYGGASVDRAGYDAFSSTCADVEQAALRPGVDA